MKNLKTLILVICGVMAFAGSSAQVKVSGKKPKAGGKVSGVIRDDLGTVPTANIIELDADGKIVAHAISDQEGKFSFNVVNPDDSIRFTYIGYRNLQSDFSGNRFDVTMFDNGPLIELVHIDPSRMSIIGGQPDPLEKMGFYEDTNITVTGDEPKRGDRISVYIYSRDDKLLDGVTVCEVTPRGRVVQKTVTKDGGWAQLFLKNPKNRISFSDGTQTITHDFTGSTFIIAAFPPK